MRETKTYREMNEKEEWQSIKKIVIFVPDEVYNKIEVIKSGDDESDIDEHSESLSNESEISDDDKKPKPRSLQ